MENIFIQLAYRVGFIIMIAFLISKVKLSLKMLRKKKLERKEKIVLGLFFGFLSIIGTLTGIPFKHAIVNTRVIGVAIAGLLGGPISGFLAGIIAGGHRFLIDIGGFTSFSCAVATILEGSLAGFLKKKFDKASDKVAMAIAIGIILEFLQMVIILILTKPFSEALELVELIALPMIFMNSLGIGIFINIIQNLKKIAESEGAYRSNQTLSIADQTLKEFKKGLNFETGKNVVEIIYNNTEFNAVCITDTKKLLAYKGLGEKHFSIGIKIQTDITKKVIKEGKILRANSQKELGFFDKNSELQESIIIPLKVNQKVIGTLKLFNNEYTIVNKELAKGLGNVFSTQLELSLLEKQKRLRDKAELHALQAQINPHFLFNAINTIISFIRLEPKKARELLIHLSDYFRKNMNNEKDLILLDEELNHLKAYLKIEKARFSDKLEIKINNNLKKDVYIPPLIIQPIVENSIKHGVLKRKNGGKVEIIINKIKDKIDISINDNGKGIDKEKLNKLNDFSINTIGLKNVYKRLRTIYGEDIIFKIDSKLNNGTKVKIQIPVLEKKEV
ncbi:MAG: LytS/YhcK type 5TM receptor domain-containing protein [Bacillota bacterium]